MKTWRLTTKYAHRHVPTSGQRSTRLLHTGKGKDKASIQDSLRSLLRETAQPVAVVTSFMPSYLPSLLSKSNTPTTVTSSSSGSGSSPRESEHSRFHGATLSSFSSISMDPHPLVAFSLRIPSRMATSLSALARTIPSSPSALPSNIDIDTPSAPNHLKAHMTINILSHNQPHHAALFSRPDLYPHPFTLPDVSYSLSSEGLPVLDGVLGAVSCRLVGGSWKLHDLQALRRGGAGGRVKEGENGEEDEEGGMWEGEGVASELFIAEVVRVERGPGVGVTTGEAGEERLPLLYHQRKYATTLPLPPSTPKS